MKTKTSPPLSARRGWKIFFWIHLILLILLLIIFTLPYLDISKDSAFIDLETTPLEFFISNVIFTLQTIVLYGYAYRKKIMTAKTWLVFFILSIVNFLYDMIDLISDFVTAEWGLIISTMMLFTLFCLFEFLAFYRYIFKSPEIWQPSQTNKPEV